MASVFTYQEDVKRIHSPWSTPGNTTPQYRQPNEGPAGAIAAVNGVTRLEPEKQDGPCEYKLHLLLRARRRFILMTTTTRTSGSLQMDSSPLLASGTSPSDLSFQRSTYQPSPQTRQIRLQQLTTQLLWRLQQSSPFHSSSNSKLVLPLLPDATPRLGVPERPAKLLPGLEESQGALYELGVADDGTLVGLVEDELDESLNNLRAMAASLGCICEVLLKVPVGTCEWEDTSDPDDVTNRQEQLFVAEVLVRPDSRSTPDVIRHSPSVDFRIDIGTDAETASRTDTGSEQLRIAFLGASAAGKSSLVGTLATSVLDNGRGKSRLSLLKHRHEIASGVTSSVAHELIGYKAQMEAEDFVINYASGDVSSWTDIHNLATRLCFLIDSPGLPKYSKSIFRSLISWMPHWTVMCVAADEDVDSSNRNPTAASNDTPNAVIFSDMSLAYLNLCLRLDLPLVLAITKMDLATKAGLRMVLGKVLSALKAAGRQPVLLSSPSNPIPTFALDSNQALPDLQYVSEIEDNEVSSVLGLIGNGRSARVVPIVMTSAVSGSGVGKVHNLLRHLPISMPYTGGETDEQLQGHSPSVLFHIDEVFSIPPSRVYNSDSAARLESQGSVLCGRLAGGSISVGDQLRLGPLQLDHVSTSFSAPRSKSYSASDMRRSLRSVSGSQTQSLQRDSRTDFAPKLDVGTIFANVRIVSLRNLRMPVSTLRQGETGTIGVELEHTEDAYADLNRVRKGLVLLSAQQDPNAYRFFGATFSAIDFVGTSPPLLLGGHALAYINSIRAAVKVTALALADNETEPSSPTEVFAFDGDEDDVQNGMEGTENGQDKEIKITFRFVSTVEWMQEGDQILVVPTLSMTGPVAGPVGATNGLAGFVGRVCELHV